MDTVAPGGASLLHAQHALLRDCGERTSGATEGGKAHVCVLRQQRQGGTLLAVLFMDHSCDPAGAQVQLLRREWDEFRRAAPYPEARVIVSEGGVRDLKGRNQEQAIARFGIAGFLASLAQESGTPIVSGEPERYGLAAIEGLLAAQSADAGQTPPVTAEHAFYFISARVFPQYARQQEERPPFRQYIEQFIERTRGAFADSEWFAGVDFSYEHLIALHDAWYPEWPIPHDDDSFVPDQAMADFFFWETTIDGAGEVPADERTPVQQIAVAVNEARDTHLAGLYNGFLDQGINVFSSFGYGHAQPVEDALRNAEPADGLAARP